jgi:hypothetical protein
MGARRVSIVMGQIAKIGGRPLTGLDGVPAFAE